MNKSLKGAEPVIQNVVFPANKSLMSIVYVL